MKTIRMNVALAGAHVHYAHGREYEVEDALADALCSDGRATPVEAETPTTKRPPRKRRTPAARAEKR